MKIYILSREQAAIFKPTGKTSMIRILEPEGDDLEIRHAKEFYKIKEVRFHDIKREIEEEGVVSFNKEMGRDLRDFFEEILGSDTVVFHCHAGISRSSAVALSFARFNGNKSMERAILKSEKYLPNDFVLEIMEDLNE